MAKIKRKINKPIYSYDKQSSPITVTVNGQIIRWLGFPQNSNTRLETEYDVLMLGQNGLTKKSIITLADNIGVNRKEMAEEIFDISVKTLERKSPGSKLDKRISSHAVEIAKIVQHAFEVFGDMEKVKLWIGRDNRALNNMKPVKLFNTLTGLGMVNDILTRIEEGVYS